VKALVSEVFGHGRQRVEYEDEAYQSQVFNAGVGGEMAGRATLTLVIELPGVLRSSAFAVERGNEREHPS
jgi:hypothetical protein